MAQEQKQPMPRLWRRLTVAQGNIIQLAGLVAGAGLLVLAAKLPGPGAIRVALLLLGWFVVYDCCHAIAHWAVGRLVGIRFRGYGVRGTDHPEIYPPGVRQIMSALPFFTVLTQRDSMRAARAGAKAAMFAAGETSTTVCALLAAFAGWRGGVPGGFALFIFTAILVGSSTVVTAITPRGDYAKAIAVLREKNAISLNRPSRKSAARSK
jgi:hypothetical protein